MSTVTHHMMLRPSIEGLAMLRRVISITDAIGPRQKMAYYKNTLEKIMKSYSLNFKVAYDIHKNMEGCATGKEIKIQRNFQKELQYCPLNNPHRQIFM